MFHSQLLYFQLLFKNKKPTSSTIFQIALVRIITKDLVSSLNMVYSNMKV